MFYASYPVSGGGGGVTSLNGLTGAITLVGAGGITITPNSPSAGDITITGSGGTVTSVGLADSTGLFNITGSPVTSSGTLTLASFQNQAANSVFAGPASGGPGAPSFRALVASDIPTLAYANQQLSNLSSTAINADLLPGVTNTINFGSPSKLIASVSSAEYDVFTSGGAIVGTFSASGTDLDISSPNGGILLSANNAGKSITLNSPTIMINTATVVETAADLQANLGASTKRFTTVYSTNVNSGASNLTLVASTNIIDASTSRIINVVDPTSAQDAATKNYVDTHFTSSTNNKELFTLNAGDITNQYIDLAHVAKTNSIDFLVQGAGTQIEGASYDYSVSYTGGAGGNTRITFLNGLATGGASALVAGNVVVAKYQY